MNAYGKWIDNMGVATRAAEINHPTDYDAIARAARARRARKEQAAQGEKIRKASGQSPTALLGGQGFVTGQRGSVRLEDGTLVPPNEYFGARVPAFPEGTDMTKLGRQLRVGEK